MSSTADSAIGSAEQDHGQTSRFSGPVRVILGVLGLTWLAGAVLSVASYVQGLTIAVDIWTLLVDLAREIDELRDLMFAIAAIVHEILEAWRRIAAVIVNALFFWWAIVIPPIIVDLVSILMFSLGRGGNAALGGYSDYRLDFNRTKDELEAEVNDLRTRAANARETHPNNPRAGTRLEARADRAQERLEDLKNGNPKEIRNALKSGVVIGVRLFLLLLLLLALDTIYKENMRAHVMDRPVTYAPYRVTFDHNGDNVYIDGRKHRLAEADAPEISNSPSRRMCGPQEREIGLEARDFARRAKANASIIQIEFVRGAGAFGRPLVKMYLDSQDLGQMLIAERLACPHGGERDFWCGPNPPECR